MINPYEVALTPHEVEQMIALDEHGITASGDTISHQVIQQLKDKCMCRWADGGYQLTCAGQAWVDVLGMRRRLQRK